MPTAALRPWSLLIAAALTACGGPDISLPPTSIVVAPDDTVVPIETDDEVRLPFASRPAPTQPPAGPIIDDDDPMTLYVSPEIGDDGNDGQRAETPLRSLQAALDRLTPGQTLYLMDGRYGEKAEPTIAHYVASADGRPDAWIRLAPAPGHEPVLAASSGNALSVRADYVEVAGLRIEGDGYGVDNAYGWGIVIRGAHHVRLVGNTVSGMPVGGLTAIESSNVEIIGNEVFDNSFWGTEQGSGISIWHAVDHGEGPSADGYHDRVVGNRIYRNENKVFSRWEPDEDVISDGNGIIVDESKDTDYPGRTLVANNIIFDNGGRGVLVTKASRVDVVFNTTYHNGRTAELQSGPVELAVSRSEDVRLLNNLAWSRPGVPAVKVTWAGDIVMGGNVFVTDSPSGHATELDLVTIDDPGLVAPAIDPVVADFRLEADSILIDRALLVAPRLPADATGWPRPADGADVGAYEYPAP